MRLDKVGVQEQRELLKGSCFLGGGNEGSDCDHRHRHLGSLAARGAAGCLKLLAAQLALVEGGNGSGSGQGLRGPRAR